jgi:hypothetical protein
MLLETTTLDFYDAVMANDALKVREILRDVLSERKMLSVRTITGILVIALENDLLEVAKEILYYNEFASDKITNRHLDSILTVASKLNLLEKLNITLH